MAVVAAQFQSMSSHWFVNGIERQICCEFGPLGSDPGMSMPYGIAVDSAAEQVYWTDRKAGRIQRLSLRCASGILEVPSRMNSTMVQAGSNEIWCNIII